MISIEVSFNKFFVPSTHLYDIIVEAYSKFLIIKFKRYLGMFLLIANVLNYFSFLDKSVFVVSMFVKCVVINEIVKE